MFQYLLGVLRWPLDLLRITTRRSNTLGEDMAERTLWAWGVSCKGLHRCVGVRLLVGVGWAGGRLGVADLLVGLCGHGG